MSNCIRTPEEWINFFEKSTEISIKEVDKRYYERKRFYDDFMRDKEKLEFNKIDIGYSVKCKCCGKYFITKQLNWKHLPKVCPTCREAGVECIICRKRIPFGRYVCKDCFKRWKEVLPSCKQAHKKQGSKIRRVSNPAKREDVREKISKGVKESYAKDPELIKKKLGKKRGEMTSYEKEVASILVELGVPFVYEPEIRIDNKLYYPDFVLLEKDIVIEVIGLMTAFCTVEECIQQYVKKISAYKKKYKDIILVVPYQKYIDLVNAFKEESLVVKIVALGNKESCYTEVEVDNITNIDYGHWLSFHEKKCHKLHFHTSWNISVCLGGYLEQGECMLIDFGDVKKITKDLVNNLDHKMLVHEKFVEDKGYGYYEICYDTDRMRRMCLPKEEVVVIDFEPTAENISKMLAKQILSCMPSNIIKVEVLFHEGTNNTAKSSVERKILGIDKLTTIIHKLVRNNHRRKEDND